MLIASINVGLDPRFLSVGSPTWDSMLVIIYCVTVLIYSFFASRERLVLVLVSLYASLAITLGTPEITRFLTAVQPSQYDTYRVSIFLGGFVLFFILLSQKMSLRSDGQQWWQAIVLSALQVGLLISSVLFFLPGQLVDSGIARDYFINDTARSAWMLAPILAMIILPRKKKDDHHD